VEGHGILKDSRDERRKQPTGGNSPKLGLDSGNQLNYGADRWFLCTIGTFTPLSVHTVIGRQRAINIKPPESH
jgi:hypothetical protein